MAGAESLRGRVALVTGASGGIGGAVARGLAGEGVASALSYGASAEPAERLAGEIESAGGRAVAIGADLARAEAAAELVDAVEQSLGPIDVLVPAAGVGEVRALDEVSVEELDRTFAVNLRAPFLLAQRTVPGMRRRGFGRVLFISSIAALTGGVVGPHYASSKAALHGLTHFLAARTAADGVTVNALAPALITNTRMLPDEPDELKDRVPVGRLGTPEEVADLALATLRNRYITNQVISIDGGMYPR
jgi:3-oxoacyl-[acyl-carrier protein] reductase